MAVVCGAQAAAPVQPATPLRPTRQQADDLEIGGDVAGVPRGETRFIAYRDLLALPQETYTVSDDENFISPKFVRTVTISGIALDKLPALLGAAPSAHMVIAICDDNYNAHYPAEYFRAHHPLLVLRVNGKPPAGWPNGPGGVAMGPYMISHPSFKPAFHVLSHTDEPQIPWGVVRLDFRNEAEVYAPIQPRGPTATTTAVHQGYTIARQNCFRCHVRNGEGGTKSPIPWAGIADDVATNPHFFDAYVLGPQNFNAASQMASSEQYDAATLAALRAYFLTFTEAAH